MEGDYVGLVFAIYLILKGIDKLCHHVDRCQTTLEGTNDILCDCSVF